MRRFVLASLTFLGAMGIIAGCGEIDPIPPAGVIRFQLDAPLCSSLLTVSLWVDGHIAAIDTLAVGLGARNHTSHDEGVVAGTHTVHAELFFPSLNDWRRVDGWNDKSVTVGNGQTVTDTLPFYCS